MRMIFVNGNSLLERFVLRSISETGIEKFKQFETDENGKNFYDITVTINGVEIEIDKVLNSFKSLYDRDKEEILKQRMDLAQLVKEKACDLIEDKFSNIFEDLDKIKNDVLEKLES